jgi:AbiJ-like protein
VPKFSSRYNYDPHIPKETILEDAPEGLRIIYLNSILDPLAYTSESSNDDGRPLRIYALSKQFCRLARKEMPDFGDFTSPWDDLKYLVKGGEWFNFYDFVEFVGKALLVEQRGANSDWLKDFGFDAYRKKVNELFGEDRIGWRLNESSELVREIPKSLADRLAATSARLVGDFAPAREHYLKAARYVSARPLDPENAIKEITSAVESVGRVFYPKAHTLGDVAREMRNKGLWPPALVAMIEKFYGYASSEPAVRHGAPVSSRVGLADAEFCLHVGVALIRYILEKHNSQKKNPTTAI